MVSSEMRETPGIWYPTLTTSSFRNLLRATARFSKSTMLSMDTNLNP